VLSKAEANRLADELLEEASRSPFGVTDPSGMPVPPMYQCRELGQLPQGVQSEIVRKTILRVGASPLFILAVAAWIALIALFYAGEWALFGKIPMTFLILAPLAPLLVRALLVRRAVRLVARQVGASWPVATRL